MVDIRHLSTLGSKSYERAGQTTIPADMTWVCLAIGACRYGTSSNLVNLDCGVRRKLGDGIGGLRICSDNKEWSRVYGRPSRSSQDTGMR